MPPRHRRRWAPTLGLALALLGAGAGRAEAPPAQAGVAAIVRVNMLSADVQRLKRFYQDAFGFTVSFEGVVGGTAMADVIARQWSLDPKARLYTVILRAPDGDTTLGLTGVVGQRLEALARPHGAAPRGGDHYMILRVRHIEAVAARLRAMGAEVWRPMMSVTGGHELGVYDPDGTRLIVEEGAA